MVNSENNTEVPQKVTNYIKNDEKSAIEVQIKFENENLKNRLEEANLRIAELNYHLLQKDMTVAANIKIIRQKDKIISNISEQMNRLERIIDEQNEEIMELNYIIESKDKEIAENEDLIDHKVEMMRDQALYSEEQTNTIRTLEERIRNLEGAIPAAVTKPVRKPKRKLSAEQVTQNIKMYYYNNQLRIKELEQKVQELKQKVEESGKYISSLNAVLKRYNLSKGAVSNIDKVQKPDCCVCCDFNICDDPECELRYLNDAISDMVKKPSKKRLRKMKEKFARRESKKKMAIPSKKKVKFSKIATVANY
ncbi:golgin subfamily A member 6-like protein 25 [Chironomus tepperi]|uniref:golgin subfamily A member 6-like protein 25 n=1 Tax=Chironomus tepperi TaxID=113505 RepID=UPI00391EFF60